MLEKEQARQVAEKVDQLVKGELIEARDAWRKKWVEMRDAARDHQRVDGLLRELVAPADDQ